MRVLTGLESPQPKSFTSWDKIEISCKTNEMSVEQLVQYISRTFGVSVDRVFLHGDTEDKAIFYEKDKSKLDWKIEFSEDGKVSVSDGVFSQWPQVRMAVQMLGRLPPASRQRAIFKSQVEKVKVSLDQTKESFMQRFQGKVSDAYRQVYRPSEEGDKQDYFDSLFKAREYVTFGIDCHTATKEEITLPCIKYMFSHEGE